MLTVEDCLRELNLLTYKPVAQSGQAFQITNTWDRRFVEDVAGHIAAGQSISTAQGELAIKLIQRYRDHLIVAGFQPAAVDSLIQAPVYARTPYQSVNLPREVRYAGNNKLVFRCKFNGGVVEDIKRLKGTNCFTDVIYPHYNREHRLWIVDVNSDNWEKVMDIIKRHRFEFDETVTEYFLEVANSFGEKSSATATQDSIEIVARNDEFLASWIAGIEALEG